MTRIVLILLVLCSACVTNAAAGSPRIEIDLRHTARVAPGVPVTLADLAELRGEAGDLLEGLSKLAILAASPAIAGRSVRVSPDDVRAAIEVWAQDRSGDEPVFAAFPAVRGPVCTVLVRAPTIETVFASEETPSPRPEIRGPTVRHHVLAKLREVLGVGPERMRVRFADSSAAFLDRGTVGCRVQVRVMGVAARVALRVTVYDPAGRIEDGTLRPEVLVERPVVRTTRTIPRGERLTAASFRAERAWVPAGSDHADPNKAAGQAAHTRIASGALIEADHLRPPLLIEKNDLVAVHCLAGPLVLEIDARALEDGVEGQRIRLKHAQGDGELEARVVGVGRAVILDHEPTKENTP